MSRETEVKEIPEGFVALGEPFRETIADESGEYPRVTCWGMWRGGYSSRPWEEGFHFIG